MFQTFVGFTAVLIVEPAMAFVLMLFNYRLFSQAQKSSPRISRAAFIGFLRTRDVMISPSAAITLLVPGTATLFRSAFLPLLLLGVTVISHGCADATSDSDFFVVFKQAIRGHGSESDGRVAAALSAGLRLLHGAQSKCRGSHGCDERKANPTISVFHFKSSQQGLIAANRMPLCF
jgi:hypothetical protein